VSTISVSVNLCNRPAAVGCDGEQSPYNDAFASSYFEMSKMFGLMRGAHWTQARPLWGLPCQVQG
jgi:hypothetical protein